MPAMLEESLKTGCPVHFCRLTYGIMKITGVEWSAIRQ